MAPQLASGMTAERLVIPLPLGIIKVEPGHLILDSLPRLLRQHKAPKTASERDSGWGAGGGVRPSRDPRGPSGRDQGHSVTLELQFSIVRSLDLLLLRFFVLFLLSTSSSFPFVLEDLVLDLFPFLAFS